MIWKLLCYYSNQSEKLMTLAINMGELADLMQNTLLVLHFLSLNRPLQ